MKKKIRKTKPVGDIVDLIKEKAREYRRSTPYRRKQPLAPRQAIAQGRRPSPGPLAVGADTFITSLPDLRKTTIRLKDKSGRVWPCFYFKDYELKDEGSKVRIIGHLKPDGKRKVEGVASKDKLKEVLENANKDSDKID